MFVKPYLKHNRTTGERYTVYKLVEGYRSHGQVTHRIIISFGRLDELETEQEIKLLGKRVEELIINGGRTLATHDAGEQIEQLARYYFEEVCRKKRYDTVFCKAEWETVNMSTLKNKDAREIGAEWLCKQAVDQLGIGNFLRQAGWEDDQYLWVRSQAKKMKEDNMNGLLSQRFEEGIQNIQEGISKKGGTKKLSKVYERIGRLKQKYPSVHLWYDINVSDDGKGTATSINCHHKTGEYDNNQSGVYFLRTSIMGLDEHVFWSIYNVIREIEYTFRVLKTDLDLRPIYHKTDETSMAHLNLGILAYCLVATIRYQLKQKGINSDWREIVRRMNTQKCVTTSIVNIDQQTISIRQCTEPAKEVKVIYDMLNYKYTPFTRKKSVVPPAEIFKNNSS